MKDHIFLFIDTTNLVIHMSWRTMNIPSFRPQRMFSNTEVATLSEFKSRLWLIVVWKTTEGTNL